jgi:hypothetical protein
MIADIRDMIPERSRADLRLAPGNHVCCPKCLRTMLVCTKKPVSGDSNWNTWFRGVLFANKPGMQPECPVCQGRFYDPFKGVFTLEHGWTF